MQLNYCHQHPNLSSFLTYTFCQPKWSSKLSLLLSPHTVCLDLVLLISVERALVCSSETSQPLPHALVSSTRRKASSVGNLNHSVVKKYLPQEFHCLQKHLWKLDYGRFFFIYIFFYNKNNKIARKTPRDWPMKQSKYDFLPTRFRRQISVTVVVAMIMYPDLCPTGSWVNAFSALWTPELWNNTSAIINFTSFHISKATYCTLPLILTLSAPKISHSKLKSAVTAKKTSNIGFHSYFQINTRTDISLTKEKQEIIEQQRCWPFRDGLWLGTISSTVRDKRNSREGRNCANHQWINTRKWEVNH